MGNGRRAWLLRVLVLPLLVVGLVALEPDDDPVSDDPALQEVVVAGLRLSLPTTWIADESPAGGCLAVWRDQEAGLVLAVARAPRIAMTEGFAAWVDGQRQALMELGEHGVAIMDDQSWQGQALSGWMIAYRFTFIGQDWYHRAHLMQIDELGLIVTLACPADLEAEHREQMVAIAASCTPVIAVDEQGSPP